MQKSKGCGYQGNTFCGLLQITWQLKTDQKHCLISALDLNVYIVMLVMLKWYAKG